MCYWNGDPGYLNRHILWVVVQSSEVMLGSGNVPVAFTNFFLTEDEIEACQKIDMPPLPSSSG
jgi:hypothetical protein